VNILLVPLFGLIRDTEQFWQDWGNITLSGYRGWGWHKSVLAFFKKIYYNNYRKIKKGVFLMTLEVLKALAVIFGVLFELGFL
jgi:hypothetical protein